MDIIYYEFDNEEIPAKWLACGIGARDHMVLIELDGELGWCSNDRIEEDY